MDNETARPRLVFVCQALHSFVKDDIALLEERFDVRVFQFNADRFSTRVGRLAGVVYYALKQLVWLLRELPRADVVFGWFAGYHAALPVMLAKRFGRPSVVVLAGTDSNWLPELGYGVYDSRWQAPLTRLVLRNATMLLPVADALIYAENRYATWPETRANGVRAHTPDLTTPARVIPFGYDPDDWQMGADEREPVVCTVAFLSSHRTLRVKGVDLLFEAARELPGVSFQVVGVAESFKAEVRKQYAPPENVELLPPRPRDELSAVYSKASVYAQLSRTEGMPNVLCEAMLCGCIPVGSSVAGIPATIGEAGIIVDTPEPSGIARAVEQALAAASPEMRRTARRRIAGHFSRRQRQEALSKVITSLLSSR